MITRPQHTGLASAQPLEIDSPDSNKKAHGKLLPHAHVIMVPSSRAGTVERPNSMLYQPGLRSFWQSLIRPFATSRPGLFFHFFQSRHITRLEIGFLISQKLVFLHTQCLDPFKDRCTIPPNFLSRFVDGQILWPIIRLFVHTDLPLLYCCHNSIPNNHTSTIYRLHVDKCRLSVV